MAISIDRVYQTVLAIANKEQRGYITPQEFNLFANRAQMEVFEQYFYDINQWHKVHGNDTQYSDMLEDKLEPFKVRNFPCIIRNAWGEFDLPHNLYKLGNVFNYAWTICEEIRRGEEQNIYNRNPLSKSSFDRPIYTRVDQDSVIIYPYDTGSTTDRPSAAPEGSSARLDFVKIPVDVKWGYVIVNDEALYDSSTTVDFEMHRSDESEITSKILGMAGINMNKLEMAQIQQEKA